MTERMDVLMVRSYQSGSETKQHYTKIGAAFALNGGGYRLKLEAVPVPTIYDGKVEMTLLVMPPRDDSRPRPTQERAGRSAPQFGGDDDIPF